MPISDVATETTPRAQTPTSSQIPAGTQTSTDTRTAAGAMPPSMAKYIKISDVEYNQYLTYKTRNTIEGYEEFISRYPNNYWVNVAKENIGDLRFAQYEELNTLEGYREFIEKYPDDPNAEHACINMEKLEFDICEQEDTLNAYKGFLAKYPDGLYWKEANSRAQELEFRQFDGQLRKDHGFDLLQYRLRLRRLKKQLSAQGRNILGDFNVLASFAVFEGKRYFHTYLIYPNNLLCSKIRSGEMSHEDLFNDIFSRELEYLNSKFKNKREIDGFSFEVSSSPLGLLAKREVVLGYYFPLDAIELFAQGVMDRKALIEKSSIVSLRETVQP